MKPSASPDAHSARMTEIESSSFTLYGRSSACSCFFGDSAGFFCDLKDSVDDREPTLLRGGELFFGPRDSFDG